MTISVFAAGFVLPSLARALTTAALVVSASVAAEALGPFWGALIAALPVSAGPAYVFLAMRHGPDFIAASALASFAANASTGPVAVLIPLKGVSQLDSPGGPYWDPEADRACYKAIKDNLKPGIPYIEMDNNINDPEFADKSVELLLGMMKK